MTPEFAKKLLDGRTPAPWWWHETDYPEVAVYHEKFGTIAKSVDIEEADLVCAAPELAEMVANMRTEYAIQKPYPHEGWGFVTFDAETEERCTTPHAHWADWYEDIYDAECIAKEIDGARVVARYVTEPVEVEP